jgi:hypothetical protein
MAYADRSHLFRVTLAASGRFFLLYCDSERAVGRILSAAGPD